MKRKRKINILMVLVMLLISGCQNEAKENTIPVEEADYEMSYYYFDSYEFVGQEYDKNIDTTYTTYNVSYNGDSFSYNGEVQLVSEYYGDYYWESYLEYCDDFEWDIEGYWMSDDLNVKDPTGYMSYELYISNVDENAKTAEVEYNIYQYIYGTDIFVASGTQTVDYVEDFTGEHSFDVGNYKTIVSDIPEEEEARIAQGSEPDFEFLIDDGEHQFAVTLSGRENTIIDSLGFGRVQLIR